VTTSSHQTPVIPIVRLAWPLVALCCVLAALFVGLYALAPDSSKPSLGPLFALFGNIPAAVAAYAAYSQSRRNAHATNEQGQVIRQVAEQTNGALDTRMREAVAQAIDTRPHLLTEAVVARGLTTLLEQHLEAATPAAAAGAPATVQTITTVTPAAPDSPEPTG
jgi:hypothetical protein